MACGNMITSLKDAKTHPRLGTLECAGCVYTYGDGDFSHIASGVDENGYDKYCRWCTGGGGSLFLCATPGCHNGFCSNCITRNLGKKRIDEISTTEDWVCFVCHPRQLDNLIKHTREMIQQLTDKGGELYASGESISNSKIQNSPITWLKYVWLLAILDFFEFCSWYDVCFECRLLHLTQKW